MNRPRELALSGIIGPQRNSGAANWRGDAYCCCHFSIDNCLFFGDLEEHGGTYQIVGYRTHSEGRWEEDPEQRMAFPPRSSLDEVIDYMIAILQDAARK
jgi:hypothetical protein